MRNNFIYALYTYEQESSRYIRFVAKHDVVKSDIHCISIICQFTYGNFQVRNNTENYSTGNDNSSANKYLAITKRHY